MVHDAQQSCVRCSRRSSQHPGKLNGGTQPSGAHLNKESNGVAIDASPWNADGRSTSSLARGLVLLFAHAIALQGRYSFVDDYKSAEKLQAAGFLLAAAQVARIVSRQVAGDRWLLAVG